MKRKAPLITIIIFCVFPVALILFKGTPENTVNFNSIFEIGESILHHVNKTGLILTAISDSEEMQVGDKIHKRISSNYGIDKYSGTPLAEYLNDVGTKVARNVKRRSIKYKFYITESTFPNAFATPGGHIYVTSGLIDALESEAELAAVLGHEITHVDAKHAIGSIQYEIKAQKIARTDMDIYADIVYQIFVRPGYSEVQETEADEGGTYLAYMAGYRALSVVDALKKACKAEESECRRRASLTPIGDTLSAVVKIFGRYFATHPPVEERIKRVKRYISINGFDKDDGRSYVGCKNHLERKSSILTIYNEEYEI